MKRNLCMAITILLSLLLCGVALAAEPTTDSSGAVYVMQDDGRLYLSEYAGDAETLTIPKEVNGVTVGGILPGAFAGATRLVAFDAEEGHTALKADGNWLLSADGKTLLAVAPYTNEYLDLRGESCRVPQSVVTIGERAFAGIKYSMVVLFHAGVKTIQSKAFDDCEGIRSLTCLGNPAKVARDFMYQSAFPVFAPEGSKLLDLCMEQQISCASTQKPDIQYGAYPETGYAMNPAETAPSKASDQTKPFTQGSCSYDGLTAFVELTTADPACEITLDRNALWTPDVNPMTFTGLYGVGCTAEKAVLRLYDANGALLGWKDIEGDFLFGMDGAAVVGIEGCAKATLRLTPIRAKVLTNKAAYHFGNGEWFPYSEHVSVQYLLVPYASAAVSYDYLRDYTVVSWNSVSLGNREEYENVEAGYQMIIVACKNPEFLEDVNLVYLTLQTRESFENEHVRIVVPQTVENSSQVLDDLTGITQAVWEVLKPYMRPDCDVQRVTFEIKSEVYPTAEYDHINLPEYMLDFTNASNYYAAAHELVHAFEFQDWLLFETQPGPFREGMAELVSEIVTAKAFPGFKNGSHSSLSFLSQDSKDDFENYFTTYYTHEAEYEVGFEFVSFLNERFGAEKIGELHAVLKERIEREKDIRKHTDVFLPSVKQVFGEDVFQAFWACMEEENAVPPVVVQVKTKYMSVYNAQGDVAFSASKGNKLTITGYDKATELFVVDVDGVACYVKGSGLSVGRDQLLATFGGK